MLNLIQSIFRRRVPDVDRARDGSSPELALRVWLFKDGNHYIAQGLDVDYVACGKTREAVEQHFAEGFLATVDSHFEEFGDLERLVKPAPQEIWAKFHRAVRASRNRTRVEERPIPGAAHKPIDAPLLNSVQFVEACPA